MTDPIIVKVESAVENDILKNDLAVKPYRVFQEINYFIRY